MVDDIFAMELERIRKLEMNHDSWYEDIHQMALILVENKAAINHVYQSKSRDVLERYIFSLSELVIKEYIKKNELDKLASSENVSFVCDFLYAAQRIRSSGVELFYFKGHWSTSFKNF